MRDPMFLYVRNAETAKFLSNGAIFLVKDRVSDVFVAFFSDESFQEWRKNKIYAQEYIGVWRAVS